MRLQDEAQQLRIELGTVKADLVRAQCEVKLNTSRNSGKILSALSALREELKATQERLQKERQLLETATRKRLEAEEQASVARLDAAQLREKLQMLECGLSPENEKESQVVEAMVEEEEEEEHIQEEKNDNYDDDDNDNDDGGNRNASPASDLMRSPISVPQKLVRIPPVIAADDSVMVPEVDEATDKKSCEIDAPPERAAATGEIEDEDDDSIVPPTAPCPVTPQSNAKRARPEAPLVMLTGYGDQSGVKVRLGCKLETLGCHLFVGKEFTDAITHVVRPDDGAANPKVIAAVLTGKFVMSDRWISDSFDAGELKSEGAYGTRSEHSVPPFSGLLFYLHSSYLDASEDRVRMTRQLIKLGGGQIVEWEDSNGTVNVDYRIVSRAHGKTRSFDITWSELMDRFLPSFENGRMPLTAKPTTPSSKKKIRVLHLSGEDPNSNKK